MESTKEPAESRTKIESSSRQVTQVSFCAVRATERGSSQTDTSRSAATPSASTSDTVSLSGLVDQTVRVASSQRIGELWTGEGPAGGTTTVTTLDRAEIEPALSRACTVTW